MDEEPDATLLEGLRERNGLRTTDSNLDLKDIASDGDGVGGHEKGKKTFGRTPDGLVFTVPQTHDMVSQLLSPMQPKNISDIFVLTILAFHIIIVWILPPPYRVPIAASIFVFWRISYNGGIGYLLHVQSNYRALVKWAKRSKVFIDPATGNNPHPRLYNLIKHELETKIPKDYKFEDAPIEYNTWLVFRRLVDLILMADFVSYCMFALTCLHKPVNEGLSMTLLRWGAGIVLVIFNLWVKVDAHRVVKDYAWYWGDFFYLIDQELTFDGVFEMAPHPMYSVGYAGYYGLSMMVGSYTVLFISILAHAAQFAFLIAVENPHIEKTYNSPPPMRRTVSDQSSPTLTAQRSDWEYYVEQSNMKSAPKPSEVHHLLGRGNTDLHRVTDVAVVLFQVYAIVLAALTPSTPFYQSLFVLHAVAWRIWFSFGLGYLLNRQSVKKQWTRHFLKYGDTIEEAWRQWKGLYHLSMVMCYTSFIGAVWKMYTVPSDWQDGFALLKHVVGSSLIVLQVWTAVSIYQSLGEFGWFYGDFFFDQSSKLTYSGIYRYLNNPERVFGVAGVWGAALMTDSRSIFFLALISHTLTLFFIHFVERPHMQKLYGRSLRQDSGISKTIKRSLPPPLKQWQGNVDKVVSDTMDFLEDFIELARPKFAAGVNTFVKDTTKLFHHYPARISITRLAPDLAGYDPKDYSLEIEGTPSSAGLEFERTSGKESALARSPPERRGNFRPQAFEYGSPIKVKWTAPLNHSKKDWVGLYMVADNASREVTRISSQGRWVATTENQYDLASADEGILAREVRVSGANRKDGSSRDYFAGEMLFSGDKLWWTQGVFEFRYHHDGKHNVLAISLPFEIRINKFAEDHITIDSENKMIREAIQDALLPVVQNCFDRDANIAPNTVSESFGNLVGRDGKYAKRVVFAILQMFGIEFAPEVVQADGNVKNLAWRICNAKRVLAPYSMSASRASRGTTTPTEDVKD